MAFLTVNHYSKSSEALSKNLIDFRNERIFEFSDNLTRATKELFLRMESLKFNAHEALYGDEMALIKEAYNQYADAFIKDREYYDTVSEIGLSDGSNLVPSALRQDQPPTRSE